MKRLFFIILDSFGIGEMPDANEFHDEGSNTLKSVSSSSFFNAPNMQKLGLFNIDGCSVAGDPVEHPIGAYGKFAERSKGKDTTTGHWEIAGLVSEKPFPTYPNGFPDEIIKEFEKQSGYKTLCNKPYSGTEVIKDYGRQHIKEKALIVYTSADSVFQTAAHEDIVPVEELYRVCEIARNILQGEHGVGRVIARPFTGEYPNYVRTSNRHDFSLKPPKDTMLDIMMRNGLDTIGVGKINDIFAGKGISEFVRTSGNTDGMQKTSEYLNKDFKGICFVNLVDFDMLYGHRNDVDGYAKAITEFDKWLGTFMEGLGEDDYLLISADHGCDPITPSTDHSREYVFMLAYGKKIKSVDLGIRTTFADMAKTILHSFDMDGNIEGTSFWEDISNE
ncbi:MAG: phosphopentomutase [Clostridia bacterium]|nr:phosphopentomutase [Clostridia bacterium]